MSVDLAFWIGGGVLLVCVALFFIIAYGVGLWKVKRKTLQRAFGPLEQLARSVTLPAPPAPGKPEVRTPQVPVDVDAEVRQTAPPPSVDLSPVLQQLSPPPPREWHPPAPGPPREEDQEAPDYLALAGVDVADVLKQVEGVMDRLNRER